MTNPTGWTAAAAAQLRRIHSPEENRPMARDTATCRVCGCSQFDACEEGCWWIPDPAELGDLCSSCEDST